MAYWKKLKNTDAVPVLKDELVFDTTPTVNSTNPVTSDGVARAIAGASGEVPVVTEGDNGKILTAIYDEGGAAVEWAEAPSGIPEYSTSDDGKVLGVVVDTSGEEPVASVDWVTQSGGGDSDTVVVEYAEGMDDTAVRAVVAEIRAGLAEGKAILLRDSTNECVGTITYLWDNGSHTTLEVVFKAQVGGGGSYYTYELNERESGDTSTFTRSSGAINGVPSASSTDDGKVLGATYNGLSTSVGWVVPTVNADGETIAGNGTVDAPLSVKHDSSLGTASVFSEIIDESNLSWTNNQYIDVTVTAAQINAIRAKLNNAEPVYLGMLFSGGPTIKLNRSSGASGKSCYMHIGSPTWGYLFIAVSTNSLGTTNSSGVVSVDLSSLALSSFTYRPENMLSGTWRIWFSASSRQYTDPIEELSNDLYNVTVDGSTAVTTEFRMWSSENALAVTNPVPAYAAGDAGKVLQVNAGGNGVEWAEAPSGIPDMAGKNGKILGAVDNGGTMEAQWIDKPSSTVSTDGVISGDGSVADPVVLNVGAGLSSASGATEWGESSTIYKLGDRGLTVPAAVAVDILTNNRNVQLTLSDAGGEWDIQDTQGDNYALALCYGSGSSWTVGVVFAPNYTDRWNNGASYVSGFHGTKTVELDMSNLISNIDSVDTDADRRAALLSSAQGNNDVLLAFARYFNDGQGVYRYYIPSLSVYNYIFYSNMSYKLSVPGSAVLSVTNPVPAFDLSTDVGKVLTVTADGLAWVTPS